MPQFNSTNKTRNHQMPKSNTKTQPKPMEICLKNYQLTTYTIYNNKIGTDSGT